MVRQLEGEGKHISKELNDQNFKLNAYSKAFPDHEDKKLEAKKTHKKQE